MDPERDHTTKISPSSCEQSMGFDQSDSMQSVATSWAESNRSPGGEAECPGRLQLPQLSDRCHWFTSVKVFTLGSLVLIWKSSLKVQLKKKVTLSVLWGQSGWPKWRWDDIYSQIERNLPSSIQHVKEWNCPCVALNSVVAWARNTMARSRSAAQLSPPPKTSQLSMIKHAMKCVARFCISYL